MQLEEILDYRLHKRYLLCYTKDEIEECVVREAEEAQPSVKANGFRNGKVPIAHIIRIYGQKIRTDVLSQKITSDIQGLVKEKEMTLAVNPIYKFRERSEIGEDDYKIDIDFYLFPEVPAIDFSQVEFLKYKISTEGVESLVHKNLDIFRLMTSNFVEKSGGVAGEHDRIVANIQVHIDGELSEGLSRDVNAILGLEQLPKEIEVLIFGMDQGQIKTETVSYKEGGAEPYHNALKDKDVEYVITLKTLEKPVDEELNEQSIKRLGFTDLNHLVDVIQKNTDTSVEGLAKLKMRADLVRYLREEYDFEIPEKVIEQEAYILSYKEASEVAGVDILSDIGAANVAVTPTDFHKEQAKKQLVTSFIFLDYARKNNIAVEDWEVKREMERRVDELSHLNKLRPHAKDDNYQKFMTQVKTSVFEDKVVEHILSHVKVSENVLSQDDFFEKIKIS